MGLCFWILFFAARFVATDTLDMYSFAMRSSFATSATAGTEAQTPNVYKATNATAPLTLAL